MGLVAVMSAKQQHASLPLLTVQGAVDQLLVGEWPKSENLWQRSFYLRFSPRFNPE